MHRATPLEYLAVQWDDEVLNMFHAKLGISKWQSLWEFVTLLLSLIVWRTHASRQVLFVLGDNIAALQDVIALKGRGDMLIIAREVAWRQAKWPLHFECQHLPKEHNLLADALSRLAAIPPCAKPAALSAVPRRACPPWHTVWQAWVPLCGDRWIHGRAGPPRLG